MAIPAAAAPAPKTLRLAAGAKAENRLRRFLEQDASLKARFDDAARREEAYLAESRESGLRDSIADFSGEELRQRFSADKRRLAQSLPGMDAAPATGCRDLAACPIPELAVEASDARGLADAVRGLVRPWMLLQAARGTTLELVSADGPGDAALVMRLKDLDAAPITVNVSPRLLGGFRVWLDRPLVLAAIYDRERSAALLATR